MRQCCSSLDLMRPTVPPKQRIHRILKESRCYLSPMLRFGRPLPKGGVLAPDEVCLGGIWGSKLESILTERGAYLRVASSWKFVGYSDVEEVIFPEKSDPNGSLTLRTPFGNIQILSGRPDLWDVGRFF
jgi:hypothetical protein